MASEISKLEVIKLAIATKKENIGGCHGLRGRPWHPVNILHPFCHDAPSYIL